MAKATTIRDRAGPEAKGVFGKFFRSVAGKFSVIIHTLGVMLYRRVLYPKRIPNEETVAALREMDAGIGVTKCENPEDLEKELDRA